MNDLFSQPASIAHQPLASRMRPDTLASYHGQRHLLAPGRALQVVIARGRLHSMIFWGPPGSGKTSLAELIARHSDCAFERLQAVSSGVKDIRAVVERARCRRASTQQKTVLFIDEIHRFNKTQQDAFLPHVEQGDVILLGATTENPAFQLQNALLSRLRVYVLKSYTDEEQDAILQQALNDSQRGLGQLNLHLADQQRAQLIKAADGDARVLLNMLEIASDFARLDEQNRYHIAEDSFTELLKQHVRHFDHHGDIFYQQISALHKSVRGSDPDAALYWLMRMLDAGADPQYLARRLLRIAYEDIGLADPRATQIALTAWQSYERLGQKEGELALAQATVYLAVAAKSNAVYLAAAKAREDVLQYGQQPVPLALCNATTKLQKSIGQGVGYRYAHDEEDAFAAGMHYFPDDMPATCYYEPTPYGLEIKISEKLTELRQQNEIARQSTSVNQAIKKSIKKGKSKGER